MPARTRLLLAGSPGMTGNPSQAHCCKGSKAAGPYGQCRYLVTLGPHAGSVGRAGSKVEVAHRDSVWHVTE